MWLMSISEFQGSLALCTKLSIRNADGFMLYKLWVMKEYGANDKCWTKQVIIRSQSLVIRNVLCDWKRALYMKITTLKVLHCLIRMTTIEFYRTPSKEGQHIVRATSEFRSSVSAERNNCMARFY